MNDRIKRREYPRLRVDDCHVHVQAVVKLALRLVEVLETVSYRSWGHRGEHESYLLLMYSVLGFDLVNHRQNLRIRTAAGCGPLPVSEVSNMSTRSFLLS